LTSYKDSIHALRELISPGPTESSSRVCRITKLSNSVSHLENGIEFCLVEVTCDGGEQYGIQAFGREAAQLYKEALSRSETLRKEEQPALSLGL
jgi:hypothetical protein